MITIIDYEAGNIKSVRNMLKRIGVESKLSSNEKDVLDAKKLILPGVGHFDYGMRQLKKSGLIEVLNQKVVVEKTPLLGICLGAQMLGNKSEEGSENGLGWINMDIVKFKIEQMPSTCKIPNMGWNKISKSKAVEQRENHDLDLFQNLEEDARFYFVHSYHMLPLDTDVTLATATYGYEYTAAVKKDNIYGVQFHPEKSHFFGMRLLENFATL